MKWRLRLLRKPGTDGTCFAERSEQVTKADWDQILRRKEEKPPLNGFVYKSSKETFFVPMGRPERWDDNLHG